MKYYIEICLLPDPEFSENQLMNTLFAKIHRALVKNGRGEIGISFPLANKTLGNKLRLHGSQSSIERVMEKDWLRFLSDYIKVSEIMIVPENCQHRIVNRIQAKSNPERLYRRSVRKGWLTEIEAEKKISEIKAQHLKYPFVNVCSNSSGQKFRLFINQDKVVEFPQNGKFSSYGLSEEASVPWF